MKQNNPYPTPKESRTNSHHHLQTFPSFLAKIFPFLLIWAWKETTPSPSIPQRFSDFFLAQTTSFYTSVSMAHSSPQIWRKSHVSMCVGIVGVKAGKSPPSPDMWQVKFSTGTCITRPWVMSAWWAATEDYMHHFQTYNTLSLITNVDVMIYCLLRYYFIIPAITK